MIKDMKRKSPLQDRQNKIRSQNSEAEAKVVKLIEDNLRKLAEACPENGLLFQAKQHGVKYCCLFMQGSGYTHLCPYVEEETVHISQKGMDMMRFKCRYER